MVTDGFSSKAYKFDNQINSIINSRSKKDAQANSFACPPLCPNIRLGSIDSL